MTLTYDAHNRLSSAVVSSTTTNYAYNGLGERVTKQTGSNTHYYFYGVQKQLLAEYDGTGNVEREYIYLQGRPVVMLDHSGSGIDIYWIHNDHLGRPLVLTDEAGDVVWRLTNADAFGNASSIDEDPDNNSIDLVFNFRFPGQHFDTETNLHYNYFRDYDPRTGRYIESDPIGLKAGLNTYLYANANPTVHIDPTGKQTGVAEGYVVIGGVLVAAAGAKACAETNCTKPITDAIDNALDAIIKMCTTDDEEKDCEDIIAQCRIDNDDRGGGGANDPAFDDLDQRIRECVRNKAPHCMKYIE
jgi:RHS repeat-associated protein